MRLWALCLRASRQLDFFLCISICTTDYTLLFVHVEYEWQMQTPLSIALLLFLSISLVKSKYIRYHFCRFNELLIQKCFLFCCNNSEYLTQIRKKSATDCWKKASRHYMIFFSKNAFVGPLLKRKPSFFRFFSNIAKATFSSTVSHFRTLLGQEKNR